jgi:hypothetical protein
MAPLQIFQKNSKRSILFKDSNDEYFVVATNDMGHSLVNNFQSYELALQYAEGYVK